jgi:hypothetical protein
MSADSVASLVLVAVAAVGAAFAVPFAGGAIGAPASGAWLRVGQARLRHLAGDRFRATECGLLFVDTSRPGRRRWCSDTVCGGRDRAAAYRRRKRTPQDEEDTTSRSTTWSTDKK